MRNDERLFADDLPRLHLLTDAARTGKHSHFDLTLAAVSAGAPLLQYREKHFAPEQHLEELKTCLGAVKGTPTRFIINDYVDLAIELQADGVHVGMGDAPLEDVVAKLPADMILGATVHTKEELEYVRQFPVDYIGVGPVFGTSSKNLDLPDLGLQNLRSIVKASEIPVVAIGGITSCTIDGVLRTGAYGIAVLSAFAFADAPDQAVADLLEQIETALAKQ